MGRVAGVIKFIRASNTIWQRYDARIGFLYVGAQEIRQHSWNWWVALTEQGPLLGEDALHSGSVMTLQQAKDEIVDRCVKIADMILSEALD